MISRTSKLFALAIGLLALTAPSYAAGEASFSKGHSTWTVEGVYCSTGTATEITKDLTGFAISGYRLTNQHTAVAVWISPDSVISTDSINGNQGTTGLGEKLTAGSNGVWELGNNPDRAQLAVKIYCKAGDAAAQLGVWLSRSVFGFK